MRGEEGKSLRGLLRIPGVKTKIPDIEVAASPKLDRGSLGQGTNKISSERGRARRPKRGLLTRERHTHKSHAKKGKAVNI